MTICKIILHKVMCKVLVVKSCLLQMLSLRNSAVGRRILAMFFSMSSRFSAGGRFNGGREYARSW